VVSVWLVGLSPPLPDVNAWRGRFLGSPRHKKEKMTRRDFIKSMFVGLVALLGFKFSEQEPRPNTMIYYSTQQGATWDVYHNDIPPIRTPVNRASHRVIVTTSDGRGFMCDDIYCEDPPTWERIF
jgi:hypothetical protein